MRYTMSQLLEYQNELNQKLDKKKVEAAIDNILREIEYYIKQEPTRRSYYATFWKEEGNDPTEHANFFSSFSDSELKYIQQYFEKMGFKEVKIVTSRAYRGQNTEIQLSW